MEGIGFKKHSGVISNFNLLYIKSGIFDKEYGMIANNAFDIRKDNDYADFYVVSKSEVIEQHKNAVRFVDMIEKYINDQIKNKN